MTKILIGGTALDHYTTVHNIIGKEDLAEIKVVLDYLSNQIVLPDAVDQARGVLMDILEPGRIAEDGSNLDLEGLLKRAVAADMTIWVYYETQGACDYSGQDVDTALTHIRNCDEMQVALEDSKGNVRAWLLCVQQGPDMDPAEEVADCSGPWLEEIGFAS